MYLDVAAGLLIGLLAGFATGEPSLALIIFGAVAALAPDIDFIIYSLRRRGRIDQYAHEHRDLLHMPLIFSVVGAFIVSLISPTYGIVWGLGTFWHFIHDTFDGGWGIRWLHPFYRGYFTLAAYSPKRHFATREEQRAIAAAYGNPHWLKGYFSFTPKVIAELLALVIAITAVIYFL